MLRVENLSKQLDGFAPRGGFALRDGFALREISFAVADGDYFVLLGASGAGKTLLLEMLAGVTEPDGGRISWNDDDISREPIQSRRMGLVYQDQSLFPHMTVQANIAYPLKSRRMPAEHAAKEVLKLAQNTGVVDLLDRYPGTLSGGEMQRVALARALATKPRCLLLDEPLSSLDTQARTQMRGLLRELHRQGKTVVHVTHDYEEAVSLATQVGIMEDGTIVQTGNPTDVFHHPKSEFIARFTGIRNVFKGRISAAEGGVSRFDTGPLSFMIAADGHVGPGCVILRTEDITLSRSSMDTSAQNSFPGVVTDVAGARLGMEVTIDIGVDIIALITPGSVQRLDLYCGQLVWVSFKATAARFVEE